MLDIDVAQGQRGDLGPTAETVIGRLLGWIGRRRRLDLWLSLVILLLGAADAWAGRHSVNADGISYLDLGDTVWSHGIKAGASVAWSPVYTWVLGGALTLVHPGRAHELIVVMAVNLLITAVLLAAFAWWLRELRSFLRDRGIPPLISEQVDVLLAYAVVALVVLHEITVPLVTPDLLLAAVAFAATAELIRIARAGGSAWSWVSLGVLLGLGYLVKAGFILPALVGCVAAAVLTRGSAGRRGAALIVTVAACVIVAAPFVAVLSSKEGKLELGGYGTINYAWQVDGVTPYSQLDGCNRSVRAACAPHTDCLSAPDVCLRKTGRRNHPPLV